VNNNKIVISKKDDGNCEIFLNGIRIDKVLDFSYNKNSATNVTEFTLKCDIDELVEVFK